MQVALDARTLSEHFPGISRYIFNLVSFLSFSDEVSLKVLVNRENQDHRLGQLQERGNIRLIPVRSSVFSLRQQLEIPRLLNREAAEVYHSSYFMMPYHFSRTPSIVTVYDIIPLINPTWFRQKTRIPYWIGMFLALKSVSRVLTVSNCSRRDIVGRFPFIQDRIDVIHPGIDSVFRPSEPREVERVRKRYELDKPYILNVGSNRPHKNLGILLEAFCPLARQYPGLQLVLAGIWDSKHGDLSKRIRELNVENEVKLLGRIPDVDLPPLYSGALSFVFPSLYEGFGLPVVEAMACGTPVACSRLGALEEVAGDAALFFDASCVDSVRLAIDTVISDSELRKRLIASGNQRAEYFDWKRSRNQIVEIYQEVIV